MPAILRLNLTIPETQTENIINDLISTGHSIGVVASGSITYPYIKCKAENHDFAFGASFRRFLYVFVHKSNPLCIHSTIHFRPAYKQESHNISFICTSGQKHVLS